MFVYKLTHVASGKAYIGLTTQKLSRRLQCHVADAKRQHDRVICKAIAKYGFAAFAVETLYEASSIAEMKIVERAMIATHRTMVPFGYNVTSGGDGLRDVKITAQERARRSAQAKQMHADGRIKPRAAGWKATPEARARMSAAAMGRQLTDKMIESARRRWSGAGNPMKDRAVVESTRQKRLGAKRTPEQVTRITIAKRTAIPAKLTFDEAEQIRYLATIANKKFVAKVYGVSRSMVQLICRGKRYVRPTEMSK